MTIEKYQELTGITVSSSQEAMVLAQIRRTQRMLESMLGFSLSKSKMNQNFYEELGKSSSDFSYPEDDDELLPPDDVENAYRLYPYNEDDRFLVLDPFTTLHAVKLVFIRSGDEPNGITLKTFETDELRIEKGRFGISKYVEVCHDCWGACICECRDCVQLAVDADWLYDACLPGDLLDVWAEMVTYGVDCKTNIKSETLGTHSYTKFDNISPEYVPENIRVLQRYAGPYGTLTRSLL